MKRQKGITALFILAVVFATFGLPIRYLAIHFLLFQQIYLRLFVATIIGSLLFYKDIHFKKLLTTPKKDWFVLTMRIIFMYGLGVSMYSLAFLKTTFSDVSFLGAIPTTAILGFIFLQEKVTRKKIFFILVSLIGILMITIKDSTHFFSWQYGDLLALIADFFFSFSYISRRWQTNFLNNKELAVLMLSGGFMFTFLLSLVSGEGFPHMLQLSGFTVCVIIIAGLLNIASIFLSNYGFAYVETFLANNIIALESFFAVIFGFLFYKEIPTIQALLGGILILASVVFINKEEKR